MKSAGAERLRAIEHADVVEAQKAALENVPSFRVLAIHPPGEIQQQLVKHALEKFAVGFALGCAPSIL